MKRAILSILLLLLTTLIVAQNENVRRPKWYVGFQAGTNIGDIGGVITDYTFKNKTGLLAQIFTQYQLSPEVGLRVGVEFDQRRFSMDRFNYGLRYTDTSSFVCWECYYAYDVAYENIYLTVPIVFVYARNQGRFAIQVKGGGYFSLLMSSKYDGYEELFISTANGSYFLDNGIEPGLFRLNYKGKAYNVMNTSDAGIMLGLGGSYVISNSMAFLLEAGLQVGFQPLFENPGVIAVYQRAYQFRGGLIYRIPFTP